VVGLKRVRKHQAVRMGGCVGLSYLIKQMPAYAAAPALLSSGKGRFDDFGHHERVRCPLSLLKTSRRTGGTSKAIFRFSAI